MQMTRFHRHCSNRSSSAVLKLLIALSLIVTVSSGCKYLKKATVDPDTSQDIAPWDEWRIRQASKKPLQNPSDKQPAVKNVIAFDSNVILSETHDPGGQILMKIYPDGTIQGMWHGTYYNSQKVDTQILDGEFKGRIYPAKIYRDNTGDNPTKLYFLGKGELLLIETDFNKGTVFNKEGYIYVNGWLNRNYSINGKITITSDEKYFETFEWNPTFPDSK